MEFHWFLEWRNEIWWISFDSENFFYVRRTFNFNFLRAWEKIQGITLAVKLKSKCFEFSETSFLIFAKFLAKIIKLNWDALQKRILYIVLDISFAIGFSKMQKKTLSVFLWTISLFLNMNLYINLTDLQKLTKNKKYTWKI